MITTMHNQNRGGGNSCGLTRRALVCRIVSKYSKVTSDAFIAADAGFMSASASLFYICGSGCRALAGWVKKVFDPAFGPASPACFSFRSAIYTITIKYQTL